MSCDDNVFSLNTVANDHSGISPTILIRNKDILTKTVKGSLFQPVFHEDLRKHDGEKPCI